MKFWEATAVLTAARWGTKPEALMPHLPKLEDMTRKALRQTGITLDMIEMEYPAELLAKALLMIELDPEAFEAWMQTAIERFVARN